MFAILREFWTGRFRLGSETGPLFLSGSGTPEGSISAPVGSIYSRTDGAANTSVYRKESGTGNTGWVAISNAGGGGGSPSGATTQIQYNDAGAFGANAGLTFDPATQKLAMLGTDADVELLAVTNVPASPAANRLDVFAKTIAGQTLLVTKDSVGLDLPVQDALAFSHTEAYFPASGTTPTTFATAVTNVGTISHPTLSNVSFLQSVKRSVWTSAATAASLASHRNNLPSLWRGNGSFPSGGFRAVLRTGLVTQQAGQRGFFGLSNTTVAPTNVDPLTSTANAKLGIAFNTNTGNYTLIYGLNGVAPTQIALGANFPLNTTGMIEQVYHMGPNATDISYQITNLVTGDSVSGTIPAASAFAAADFFSVLYWMTNNATAAAVAFASMKWTTDADY
ncbi:MAG: hypothetical protein ACKO0Z_28080 [Betaproteobacteria bacterium]